MNAILVALLLVPLAQNGTRAPASGDAQAGKALWEGAATQCKNCHGLKGEGAFGPDLAGRQLGVPQFRQAVRHAQLTAGQIRSEEHTSELQSHSDLVCRLLLEKKKKNQHTNKKTYEKTSRNQTIKTP